MVPRGGGSGDLGEVILEVAGRVRRTLGARPTVSEMEDRFVEALVARRVRVTRRAGTTVCFNGVPIEKVLGDVVLEGRVMVEFKRLPALTSADLYRFAQFLKMSGLREGFIINLTGATLDCRYLSVAGP